MDRFWIPALALAAVVLQTTLVPALSIAGAAPDLVFLYIIFLSFQRPTTLGLWMAFWLGLLQDLAAGAPLGLNALLLVGLAYLAGHLRRQFFSENVSAQMLIVLLFTFLHQFLALFWMNTLMRTQFGLVQWLVRALGMSLYHVALAPLLFHWLSRLVPGESVYRHLVQLREPHSRVSPLRRSG